MLCFSKISKLLKKFIWNFKGPNNQTILEKKNKFGALPHFKTYYKAIIIKIVQNRNKESLVGQQNRIKYNLYDNKLNNLDVYNLPR